MITQLLISSGKPIITASYVIVGGGGGAVISGANGQGGTVINGDTTIPDGSYSITIGAGGSRGGGLGSSSSFMGLIATGSTRTTTVTVNGETFSGIDAGSPNSAIKGSGALASSIVYTPSYCTIPGASSSAFYCEVSGGSWVNGYYQGGDGNNGVVILTIPTIYNSRIVASGAVVTTSGSNTIYRFNSSGSLVTS
jgi:hypothetical protein